MDRQKRKKVLKMISGILLIPVVLITINVIIQETSLNNIFGRTDSYQNQNELVPASHHSKNKPLKKNSSNQQNSQVTGKKQILELVKNKIGLFSSSVSDREKYQSIQDLYQNETNQSNAVPHGWKAIKVKNGKGWFVCYSWKLGSFQAFPVWWIGKKENMKWVNGHARSRTEKQFEKKKSVSTNKVLKHLKSKNNILQKVAFHSDEGNSSQEDKSPVKAQKKSTKRNNELSHARKRSIYQEVTRKEKKARRRAKRKYPNNFMRQNDYTRELQKRARHEVADEYDISYQKLSKIIFEFE